MTRAHTTRLFAARPEAVSVGSDAWILRAVQHLSASDHNSRSRRLLESLDAQLTYIFRMLRGTTVDRTYGRHKKPIPGIFLLLFIDNNIVPIYYGPP